jgi:hypothetical protein
MIHALLKTGLSERQLGELLKASQPTVNRLKNPDYRPSDALGQRVRALYRRTRTNGQRHAS